MPHYKTLIDTNFLGQWDLPHGRDVVVTIESVQRYTPAVEKKKKLPDGRYVTVPNRRIEIRFVGKKKAWLAGPVSHAAIAGMYGPNTDAWIGKQLALYVDPDVEMAHVQTGGIRCRPQAPKGQATDDPLDRPVDDEAAARIAMAKEGV